MTGLTTLKSFSLRLAAALRLRFVAGLPVGLQLVGEQDLDGETDSFGLEDAVGVVESQHVCGGRRECLMCWIQGCTNEG